MVVSTKTECPDCLKDGKHLILQADISMNPPRIYCENGHTVTDVKQVADPPPVQTPALVPEASSGQQRMALEAIPGDAPKIAEPVAPPVAAEPVPIVPAPPRGLVPTLSPGPKTLSPLERLAKFGYIEIAGGDLIVQVRIPETYVGHLKEAASRYYPPTREEPDTLQKHLQGVFDTALRLGWAD